MTPHATPSHAIVAESIRKTFGGVAVLEGITFDIRQGEVHTLMGENGAGKSTLMNILAGIHRPDAGTIRLFGNPVSFGSPHPALKAGIALIHQEPQNFPDLSISENIFIGRGMPRGSVGQLDRAEMHRRSATVLGSLGVSLDPRRRMRGLSIADQQTVELAGALAQNAKVLLMDEPTAALTPGEVARLFAIVRKLRDEGVAIVFISHRIPEVFQISDRITVLRDGQCIGTREVKQTDPREIVRMMVGRPLGEMYEKPDAAPGKVMLRVRGLASGKRFSRIDFDVRAGEIVGIAGLVGAGRTEVAETIFGIRPRDAGTVEVDGKPVSICNPHDAIGHGIAYVPEDRARNGLLLPMSISANTTIANLSAVSAFGFISGKREVRMAESWRGALKTRSRDVTQPLLELSGGNQQKVVLGRWLETKPKVLIVDEPTRGIDVGAKAEVHHVLAELARQGSAILMISSDLPEVIGMSDRVLVMKEGRRTGEFARGAATQEGVMHAATVGEEMSSTLATSHAAPRHDPGFRRRLDRLLQIRELGVLLFIIVLAVIAALFEPRFLRPESLRSIVLYIPLILIVATGQLMVIVSRNIDLSVGSMLGLSVFAGASLFVSYPDAPIAAAAILSVAVGIVLGGINGALVTLLRVPAIIATLGTMTAYRGLIYMYSGGKQIDKNNLPQSLISMSQEGPMSVPWLVWIAGAVAGAAMLFLRYTSTGREIYAIGSNPRAAQLRGLAVNRVLMIVFALTGGLCGLAGILFASRYGTVNPASVGVQMELIAISAVVLGGAAVNGGAGSILGTVLGCVLLAVVATALPMLRVSEHWQSAFYGGAILLACVLDYVLRARRREGALA